MCVTTPSAVTSVPVPLQHQTRANLVLCAGQTLPSTAQLCPGFISDPHGPWRVIGFIIYLCETTGAPKPDPSVDAEPNPPDAQAFS